MLGTLSTLVSQTIEGALAVVGIRAGTEEPSYTSKTLTDHVELREYGPRIAAETTVAATDEESARSEGFRRLAGYIFGKNHRSDAIAMTAPVAQAKGQKIAMTAPVAQAAETTDIGEGSVIRFYMPSKWTLDTLPEPNDNRVRLVVEPAATFAVLGFTGDRSAKAVAARTAELLEVLRQHGFEPDDEPAAWFYDPPWTLPFRRRNEIAVPVSV